MVPCLCKYGRQATKQHSVPGVHPRMDSMLLRPGKLGLQKRTCCTVEESIKWWTVSSPIALQIIREPAAINQGVTPHNKWIR
jgi:hypothetical protein